METRIFDVNPQFGITQFWHYDPDTDKVVIEAKQSHAAIVEANKSEFNATDERARWGEGQHVARILLVILQDLQLKGILADQKKFKAWLNDPENRHFRTRPGKV